MKKILIIGSTVADIIINISSLPRTSEDVNISSQEMSLEGCAYSVSDMVRHFGVPYTLFSPIGTGIYGDFIRNQLAAKGLASPMPTPDQPNGCCYCFVEECGERTFVCHHGAEYLFRKEWFDQIKIEKVRSIYVCGLELEDKTGDVILDFLEANSELPVFFAPGPRIKHIEACRLSRIFALHPTIHLNRDEICAFTDEGSIEGACRKLFILSQNTIIVTDGASGCYYYDGEDFIHVAPVKASKVVDTIGAGDGHAGAVLACLSRGDTIYEAIKKANAASALVVANKGAILSDNIFNQAMI